jgi:hypothetical protein
MMMVMNMKEKNGGNRQNSHNNLVVIEDVLIFALRMYPHGR